MILLAILANTALLAIQDPMDPQSLQSRIFDRSEIPFLVLFAVEMALKIVAGGLWFAPKAYLRDGWNVVDMIVVVTSLISVVGGANVSAIRALRALRPLRALSRFPGRLRVVLPVENRNAGLTMDSGIVCTELRMVTKALLRSIPRVVDVIFVCFFALLIFSIIALQLWVGVLRRTCVAPDGSFDGESAQLCIGPLIRDHLTCWQHISNLCCGQACAAHCRRGDSVRQGRRAWPTGPIPTGE